MRALASALASAAAAAGFTAAASAAEPHRQLGAHVHGRAELAAALDGEELRIELRSPLANLVGFEHAPRDDAERSSLDTAIAFLRGQASVVAPDARAGCRIDVADVGGPSFEDDGDEDESEDHGPDDHEAGDRGTEEAHEHAEVTAAYTFTCAHADALASFELPLFETFPGMASVEATFLDGRRQVHRELKRGQRFDLGR